MKQSIQFRLGRQLTMTPQLRQAIRLLQLSTLGLRREIQEALDSNLMLENAEEVEHLNGYDHLQSMDETLETAGVAVDPDQEICPEEMPIPNGLPVDVEWTDHYDSDLPGRGAMAQATNELDIFARHSKAPTLRDHLPWQLNLSRLDAAGLAIATAIVDAINEDGYFTATPEELLDTFDDVDLTPEDVKIALHRVRSLDPPGVGARDLRECLLIQLRHLPEGTKMRGPAIDVCDRHFEALAKNDREQIRRALRLSAPAMDELIDLIRSPHSRPGTLIADTEPQYAIPDVIVRKRETAWIVELNSEIVPRLRVNPDYAKLIRRADRSRDNQCLKSHLQEARWFINSLASRNDTVLQVASKIVELHTGLSRTRRRGDEAHGTARRRRGTGAARVHHLSGDDKKVPVHPKGHVRAQVFLLEPPEHGLWRRTLVDGGSCLHPQVGCRGEPAPSAERQQDRDGPCRTGHRGRAADGRQISGGHGGSVLE